MSDCRVPSYWLGLRRYQALDPADFRAFIYSLSWSVDNRTDGRIGPADLPLIRFMDEDVADRLTAAGVFVQLSDGWLIDNYEPTQTTAAEFESIEHARAADRERQRKNRAEKRAEAVSILAGHPPVRSDVHSDVHLDVHSVNTRQGKGKGALRTQPPTKLRKDRSAEAFDDDDSGPVDLSDLDSVPLNAGVQISPDHDVCRAPGCGRPPRRSCVTCFDHMGRELEYRGAS